MREKRQRIVKDANSGNKSSDSTYGKRTFKKGDNTPPPSREKSTRTENPSFGKTDRSRFDNSNSSKSDFRGKSDFKKPYESRENTRNEKSDTPFSKEFKPRFDRNLNSDSEDRFSNRKSSSSFDKSAKQPFNSRRSAAPNEKSFSNFFKDDAPSDAKTPNGRNWTYKERKAEGSFKKPFESDKEKAPFKRNTTENTFRTNKGSVEQKPNFKTNRKDKDQFDIFDDKFDYDNYKGGDLNPSSKPKRNYESKPENKFTKRAYTPKPYSKKTPTDNILSKQHDDGLIRLNKYISNAGICSRREADELIQTGVIKVNGKVVTDLGVRISPTDIVLMEGQKISQEKKVYILVNKPKDFITTVEDPQDRKTVMNLVKDACKERVYPVGRLDRNTTGVLLLTNDGELTKKLTHPKYEKSKMYHVFLDKPLTKAHFELIEQGVELEDGFVKVDAIDYVSKAQNFDEVGVELHSGRNRIVRRIFESLDYRVLKLDRVMFAGLTKKDLPRGRWRFLTPAEVSMLYNN